MRELGIYIHIPFCLKKCKYCDFISFENKFEQTEKYCQKVLDSIINFEDTIQYLKNTNKIENPLFVYNEEIVINTIYFGGGTPSSIDANLIIKILECIKQKFTLKKEAEITIEINPGSINKDKLILLKKAGFNRISIGLQETHNDILNLIGRIHTYEQFLEVYNIAREVRI